MSSKQNTNRQKQKKNVSKTIFTARSEQSDVQIQKHFKPSKKSRDETNKGVDSFPIVGDVEFESNVEVSLNIDKPDKITKKSFFVSNPTEISLDVVVPNEVDANFEFFNNNNDFNTCTSLNKKVEDINKQLADLEKDIQFNFYDPKTKVGSNLKKYSSHLPSFSSSKNPSNTTTTSTASDYGNFNKFNNAPKESDATIELKNEIYNYRSSLKQKQFEENIEKRLTKLHKQKEQSEMRKNETKVEIGHEPTCPLSLKIDLPEPVLKIHEMQLTAKRLKIAEESGALNSTRTPKNASPSQKSPQKTDQTIQNNEQKQEQEQESKPSTSKPDDTTNNVNNETMSISDVDVGVVRQLNSLLKKSTNELDELKSLLKKYLETEKNNKSPRSDKNVKFSLTHQQSTNTNTRKKSKPPSRSSSNSDVSLTSQNVESRKKPSREPQTCQITGIEKKSKVVKIKQTSKSTKTTKCELSDISESNELERNSSSSDVAKSKPAPVKKQNSKKENCKCEPTTTTTTTLTSDKQTEFMLNIVSKSSSSLLSSDEDKLTHIRDYIEKPPKDSNDLTNPPNTDRLPLPLEKKTIDKKNLLEVQILPALDIKRPLTTQKLPDVAIEAIDAVVDLNKMSSENVKYIEITHGTDTSLPKEQTSEIVKSPDKVTCNTDKNEASHSSNDKKICTKICSTQENCPSKSKSKATDVKIEEIYIAQQQLLSSCDALSKDDIPSTSNNKKTNTVPKERGTVSEELNLDIDSLPSVRTLKEIQNYLEQKCALIRTRLEEESKLKPGETLSLRYKLSEPPLWQSSNSNSNPKVEPESKNTIPPEQTPKPITLSPLKTYSSIKSPLSPLQKHDKSQQITSRFVCKPNSKQVENPVKTSDKSLQVSISENTDLPVARKDNTCCSSQLSVQTSNKDIHETKESFNTPPLTVPKTATHNENSDSIREITVSPQKKNLKVVCFPCKDAAVNTNNTDLPKETNTAQLVPHENEATNKALTDENKFSNISTQINEFDYVKCPSKHVSFEVVTKQYSFVPNENKETQISQLDLVEDMTKIPKDEEKKEAVKNVEKKQCKNEKTQTTKNEEEVREKEAPVVRYMQSNATQTINVKDKFTICNIPRTNKKEEEEEPLSTVKETKECCTQYSPVLQPQDLDATEYKKIDSFRKVDTSETDEQNKHVHYHHPLEERRNYYCRSKMKNKRPLQRHKMCSTPVSPSSVSTTTETVSLSDGEVKLSCECSTSIGEIHLCRFANSIRKKVKILKQNPEDILRESFGKTHYKMKRQHKYNDNWFAYYVTKTESSSEHGTGSNLSSIKSNIETE